MLKANETKVLRKIIGKTKQDSTRSQKITESCGIQLINEWVARRREWDEQVTRMDVEWLVKISRGNTCQEMNLQGIRREYRET